MTPEIESEITTGPLAAEIAPLRSAGDLVPIAAALNRRDIPTTRACQARLAKTVLLVHGLWGSIKTVANTPAHPVYAAALTAYEIGQDPGGEFDFASPRAKPMLDALQSVGLVTPEARAEIVALCQTTTSRAEQVLGREVAWSEFVE